MLTVGTGSLPAIGRTRSPRHGERT